MLVRKPNHFKLALQLEEDAADPKHRPCHREKLLQAAARERELAQKELRLTEPVHRYYDPNYRD